MHFQHFTTAAQSLVVSLQFSYVLKFRYCEKATKFENISHNLKITQQRQNRVGMFFSIFYCLLRISDLYLILISQKNKLCILLTSVYKLIKNKPYIEMETGLVFPNVILNFGFMWVQNAHLTSYPHLCGLSVTKVYFLQAAELSGE